MSFKTITADELKGLLASGKHVQLIDVRTPAEYEEIHVQGARLIPLDQLDAKKVLSELAGHGPLYVLCRSGNRARMACERLLAAGGSEIILVEGGTLACEKAGLPVVRGRRMLLSIEQQVRLVIGTSVLIFSLLGYFVHPAFVFGAALFGLGLIYVGLTNNCLLALILSRMPWNRRGSCGQSMHAAASGTSATVPASTCTPC